MTAAAEQTRLEETPPRMLPGGHEQLDVFDVLAMIAAEQQDPSHAQPD